LYLFWLSGAVGRRTPAVLGAVFAAAAVLVSAAAGAPDAVVVSLFGPMILFLASLTSTGSRLGSDRFSVWLGEISYAVYMTCVPFGLVFFNAIPKIVANVGEQMPWFIWIFSLAGTVFVAAMAHHLVERPARTMLRNWSWPRLSRGAKTTA
jgi:peptidoglycan/LPS O-acetylase OafA/YrhL